MYEARDYRKGLAIKGLVSYEVRYETTDLLVLSERDLSETVLMHVRSLRSEILGYAAGVPDFLCSLSPLACGEDAPLIVKRMTDASMKAGVGPMAAVAGGIAELVGNGILEVCRQAVVENGGDIFIKIDHDAVIKVFAGYDSPYRDLKVRIPSGEMPLGICTSSGRIGPSLSFGDADAVCIVSKDSFLADACATSIANMVRKSSDIDHALKFAESMDGVTGAIIIRDDKAGLWGDLEIVR